MARRQLHETPADGHAAIGGDFDLTPELEAAIDRLARAGRADPEARNALYAAFSFKIARFLAPYRNRSTPIGEFADLQQEAFLVFAGLVADWTGAGSFARYFLGFFPWRLRHAIEAYARRWPRDRILIVHGDGLLEYDAGLFPEIDLAVQLGPLDPQEARLLVLHLVEERSLTAIAPLLGWSPRTTQRRWRALRDRLERQWTGEAPITTRLLTG